MAETPDLMALTADIVSAHVANNSVSTSDLPALISATYAALSGLGEPEATEPERPEYTPATTARKSLANPNRIISMIDGKPYSSLKRRLSANGLTAAEYRERYGLKADYPMVAPGYSERRREVAKSLGLGRKKAESAPEPAKTGRGGAKAAAPSSGSETAPKGRGRPRKALSGAEALAKARQPEGAIPDSAADRQSEA